jgi:outer membrane lipoprotein LolB
MPTFTPLKIFSIAVVGALLSACATPTANLPQAPVAAYRDAIELSGRLSVNYHKDGKPESLSGKFAWSQSPSRIDISLDSPLGQTIARISVTPDGATLTQSGQAPRVARDLDTLTAQTLGWSLPVSGLRDWLQGYATTADGKRFAASPSNDSVQTRDAWRLRFMSWQVGEVGHPAPRRIDAERSADGNAEDLAIRIVIDPRN